MNEQDRQQNWEKKLKRQIQGLSFVEFGLIDDSFKIKKCSLYEPVYIMGYKIFENEDQLFKVKSEQYAQDMFNKRFIPNKEDIKPLSDFQTYLQSDHRYIHDYFNEKREEEIEILCKNCKRIKKAKESKESSTFHEQNDFNAQQEESKNNNSFQKKRVTGSYQSIQSKIQGQQTQEMSELIFIFNEEGDNLDVIKKSLKDHSEQKNIIQISHFMNINTFSSYTNFKNFLDHQLKPLVKELESVSNEQNDLKLSQLRQNLSTIERAMSNMKKIILFDSYQIIQKEFKCGQNQVYLVDLVETANFNHNFYAIAAEEIEDFDYIANRLNYYHKVSPYSIFSNVQERINNIVFNTVKDILRISLMPSDANHEDLHQALFNFRRQSDKSKLDLELSECESIIYKNICQSGLLPINIYLNKQIKNSVHTIILKLFRISLPYSPKFHLNIQLMNKFYSFTTNSIFNCRDMESKERKIVNNNYTKIRVLDFFPLDAWVSRLGQVVKDHLLDEMKGLCRKNSIATMKVQLESKDQYNIICARSVIHKELKQILDKKELVQAIKEISFQFMKEYFFELRIFQKWSQVITKNELNFDTCQNNCQTGVSEMLNHITTVNDDFYESSDCAYDHKRFEGLLKKEYQGQRETKENQFQRVSLNINQPYAFSHFSICPILQYEIEEEKIIEYQNRLLLNSFQKFSSSKNQKYLEMVIEPIFFELPLPKYKYFTDKSHINLINEIQEGTTNVGSLYQIVEELFEKRINQNQNQQTAAINFTQFKNIKSKILSKILQNDKTPSQEEFDHTHSLIKELICDSGRQRKSSEINKLNQIQNIIPVLIQIYDSWYFQRKVRIENNFATYKDQYQVKDILNELIYYYYNSVRLASQVLFTNDKYFSIVGHLIIKNPAKKID